MPPETTLHGDARVDVLSHARLLSNLEALPALFRQDAYKHELAAEPARRQPACFDLRAPDELRPFFEGSATMIRPTLEDLVCRAEVPLTDAVTDTLGIQEGIAELGTRFALEVCALDLFLFVDGYVSLRLSALCRGGWDDGRFEAIFSATRRDRVFAVYTPLLTQVVAAFTDAIAPRLRAVYRRNASAYRPHELDRIAALAPDQCNDSHLVYGGRVPQAFDPCAPLAERYRAMVYPSGPEPLHNQDIYRTGFVRLDYAFDIVGQPTDDALREKMQDLSVLLRYLHFTYYQMYYLNDEIKARIDSEKVGPRYLRELYSNINNRYTEFKSPTFTHRYEYIIYRKIVLERWFVSDLFDRLDHLLNDVANVMEQREYDQRQRVNQKIQYILLVITLLSIIGIIGDIPKLQWVARALDLW